MVQKNDQTQFSPFILSELDFNGNPNKRKSKAYFLWVAFIFGIVIVLVLGVFNGGALDKTITEFLRNVYSNSSIFSLVGEIFGYSFFIFIIIGLVCLVILFLYLNSKTKNKVEKASKYAILYLFVMSFSFIDHIVLQIIVNRDNSSFLPYYIINPSFNGIWRSSFPNNNMILSGVLILLPILFGNRSKGFKWTMGIISGVLIVFIGFSEIGNSRAWFIDIFASLGIVLFWSWFFYWHILFIKDTENQEYNQKLNGIYNQAYAELLEAKNYFYENKKEECKSKLLTAKDLYNKSISSIQNISGDISSYIQRNKFWKFNVNQLLKEVGNPSPSQNKWMYIF